MRKLFLFSLVPSLVFGGIVPEVISWAGMKLILSGEVREQVSVEVQKLQNGKNYIQTVCSRAAVYFPVIEQALKESDVPDDFKFLAIHESALNPNAVSKSWAVGFWQFKDYTAREVGLEVNKEIDERKHIYLSTVGAANYLARNNRYFDNWIYAMLSYYTGAGGAKPFVKEKYFGKKEMHLERDTHRYLVLTFAYKIVFEDITKNLEGKIKLKPVPNGNKNSLREIAERESTPFESVREYNPWALTGNLPKGKNYIVFIPVSSDKSSDFKIPDDAPSRNLKKDNIQEPEDKQPPAPAHPPGTIVVKRYDTILKISLENNVSLRKLRRWNNLGSGDTIKAGDILYITEPSRSLIRKDKKMKRKKEYRVKEGDTLYRIAQKFDTTVEDIKNRNDLKSDTIHPGQILKIPRNSY